MYYILLVISLCLYTGRHTVISGQEKKSQGFWKIRPKFPIPPPRTHTLLYSQPHIFDYTSQPTAYIPTLIALVGCQITMPQM